ncbi:MAG: type II lipoprotein signal peptidase [Candidatus Scalindua rubra]|uniref:Lipoprotein signal peptidase n=1 Tax=Candidatus Scalindua rubra TaxID=1872076 RepID=A0A1E3X552_9BACT|nr:MAG: type II lipoprotein signal peptidase [Candidatus Scalindua rubra]
MKRIEKTTIILLILSSCIGCDQVTKNIAKQNLNQFETINLLKGTLQLRYVENSGGFLGFGSLLPESIRFWLFTVLVGFFIVGMLLYLLISNRLTFQVTVSFSLIISGAIGNFVDRLLYEGKVIDFLNLGVGSLRTGIFNVADFVIIMGMIWIIIISIKGKRRSNSHSD